MNIYNYSLTTKSGKELSLSEYKGKVLLIVNTASKCGFTPQYDGLEALYKKYQEQGLMIIGVPCNQFGDQEPGTNNEVQEFCRLNYGVTFPIMAKTCVRGEEAEPLFKYLIQQKKFEGFKPSPMTDILIDHFNKNMPASYMENDEIKWNFTKFLIDTEGNVIARFEPVDTPEDIEVAITKILK